jgi:hypothetical protein
MNALALTLVFLIIVLLVALAIMLIVAFRSDNPFKPAFASLVGALVLWVGHLGTPDLEGKMDVNIDLRPAFTMHGTAVRMSNTLPFQTECLAIGSILVLAIVCAWALHKSVAIPPYSPKFP